MSKYVRETKAGRAISAWVIMKGARYVATVQSHYGDGGRVLVNVWQQGDAYKRSAKAAGYEVDDSKAFDLFAFQSAHAGGGGYDKFTAALSGMWIDGHKMSNHCGDKVKPPKGRKLFPHDYKAPKGYRLANWLSGERATQHTGGADEACGWADCYRLEGLRFLEDVGYTVVQAI